MTIFHLPDEQATEALGRSIAPLLRPGDCIGLFGTLGAGKTSLSRGILLGLGHEGEVGSPTFPIVQTYEPPDVSLPIWHVDLYRIEDPHELDELGLDEALMDSALLSNGRSACHRCGRARFSSDWSMTPVEAAT